MALAARPPTVKAPINRLKLPRFASPTGGTKAFGTPDGRERGPRVPRVKGSNPAVTHSKSIPEVVNPGGTPQPKSLSPENPVESKPLPSPKAATPTATPTTTAIPQSTSTVGVTGGTPAPTPTAPGGAPPTSPTPAGPPAGSPDIGMPNTTINVIPTAQGVADRSQAEQGWGNSQTEYGQNIANAALDYGTGPAGEANPNSALAIAALKAKQNTEQATANRGAAKTIESSLYGEDKTKISEAHSREDLLAYQKYQLAMQKYNNALIHAREAYEEGMRKGNVADVEGAEHRLPEPGSIAKAPRVSAVKAQKVSSSKVTSKSTVPKTSGSVKKIAKVPKAKLK